MLVPIITSRHNRQSFWYSPILVAFLWTGSCSAATLPFLDDFERGLDNWSPGAAWGVTTARYASPGHAATDSPGAFYTNNTDAALALAVSLDLSGASHPALSFEHSYALEAGYDYGYVEVSTDGGSTWLTPVLAAYNGNLGAMSREQLDLSPYAGAANFRLRFRLVTDSSVVMDGWYVDDVRVAETPAAVTLRATQTNRNSVVLAWDQAAAPGFGAYRLYRSLSPGVDWHSARLVAEISSNPVTNVTDTATSPKTRYYYRVAVVNTDGMLTLGNEIAVTTLAGMDYPFVDNGEGGGATWTADSPWALSDEDAASPAHAWSDSPGGDYTNGIASQALTLAAPVFLAGQAKNPVLCFNQKYDFKPGDSANVEVSTNFGADWGSLAVYTGTATNAWQRGRMSLSAYTNSAVLVRFRLTTDSSGTADGWHLDDISLAESPNPVSAPILDEVTSHSIRVSWAANTDAQFAHYVVFRSLTSGVGINSVLVATISDQAITSFTDTGLALDTSYYYRVYAVGNYGTFSPDSELESAAHTLNNPTPYADGFEAGLLNWNLTGSWGLTTNYSHSGVYSLTDSPEGNYGNSDNSYALTAVNLTGTSWPVLRFWDRYRTVPTDSGAVEISTDGSSWQTLYGFMGVRTNWAQQAIDLSPWKSQSNLRIRFRFATDGNTTEDGWYIDDLTVSDGGGLVSLPVYESFEGGLGQWLASGWDLDTNVFYSGTTCARLSVAPRLAPNAQEVLELAGAVDLTNAVNPQLTFWVRGQLLNYSALRAQVSSDGGVNWSDLSGANLDTGFNADWTRKQVSLQSQVGRTVRVRFRVSCDSRAPVVDMALDKVTVAEMPAGVYVEPPVPHLRSVDLSWTTSTLGAAFCRYEVYRATHANVTVADSLAGTLTNVSATAFTDTELSIGTKYYYRVFTVDTNDMYADSNEPSTTTVPLELPVADGMESLAQWVTSGTWGLASNSVHSGNSALTDSPGGDYANSSDSYALTAVNLTGTSWPVLRFWDRYRTVATDWGAVEISTDGSSWQTLYGFMGVRTNWAQQAIDLSPWKSQSNLRIRFRLATDGNTTEDGWYIDDLTVSDGGGLVSLPVYESFEGGLGQWLASGWDLDTNVFYSGTTCARLSVAPRLAPNAQEVLELAGAVDLTNAVNPQLTFWVRGQLLNYSALRAQVSSDGGVNWSDLSGANLDTGFNADWTRKQVSLQSQVGRTVRVRFRVSCDSRAPVVDMALDKVTVAEMPAGVYVEPPVPHLRSVDLSWTTSTLGAAFCRYEVYRATHANVTVADSLAGTLTNVSATAFTDTELSIGTKYYYRVFTVDTNDMYADSNEPSTTTVPLELPVADGMESLAQWVTSGTWGLASNSVHSGNSALTDSPGGDYANSSDSYALTAVNLTGTSWPVLRFWDRYRTVATDWGAVEISTDGSSWQTLYGFMGVRTNWAQQAIDLSPWKSQSNLRIRFRLATDGNTTEDGWYIDDLTVSDGGGLVSLPVYESFEGGLGQWLASGWDLDTNVFYSGTTCARLSVAPRLAPNAQEVLELAGAVDLTNAVNPQLTFWVRGQLLNYSALRAQVSSDGGVNWSDLSGANLDTGFNADWTRKQVSLQSQVGRTVRVRFRVSCDSRAPVVDMALDKITIEEAPPSVVLDPITEMTVSTLRLAWATSTLPDFKEYRLYRSETPTIDEGSVLVAVLTNRTTASYVDIGLTARKMYYYRLYVYDAYDTGIGSNQSFAMTDGLALGWSDTFETNRAGWTFTGTWTLWPGAGRDGSAALVDSPGDYANSFDTSAQFGVNLAGSVWPVLRFWDRHVFANGDYGRLEISVDAGASWKAIYGAAGTRAEFAEQSVDLSPWKNSSQVWLRFRVTTDGNTTADGWAIDDLSVAENTPRPGASSPLYDDFQNGLGNWLHAGWALDTNEPYAGDFTVHDTVPGRLPPDTQLALVLANELSLSNVVSPLLTFWVRGHLLNYSSFRAQVSTNGGVTWMDQSVANLDSGFDSDWTRKQISLLPYTNATARLRFLVSGDYHAPDEDIFLDGIGIGEPAPGVPMLSAPAMLGSVNVLRPALVVTNAFDYQSDPLTYRFEVYADDALSNLVSQVPAVASGAGVTTWPVDVDLPNNAQYWWRCRASDGANTGPWMPAASFFVNQVNHSPLPVLLAGPPSATILSNLDDALFWYPTTDPDSGDGVASYHLQADEDPLFASPEISVTNIVVPTSPGEENWAIAIALGELTSPSNLVAGAVYHWRVRAADTYGAYSDWSAADRTFQFGFAPPLPATLSGLRRGPNGTMTLDWQGAAGELYVEFSLSLTSPNWQTIAGPLNSTNWTFTPVPGGQSGFYRVRSE